MAIGALFTLVVWWIAGKAFGWYIVGIANYSATYAGLAGIEDGRVNVCGLFRVDRSLRFKGSELLLTYLARGASNKEIARTLEIAETTVKIHVQHILRKLNLSSRVQAAVFASGRV